MADEGRVDRGQWRAGLRPEELLPEIRRVSLAAVEDPDDVFDLTQTRFDAKAEELGVEIPKAKSLASRFSVKWRELLEIAHATPQKAAQRLGLAVSDRSRKSYTVAECAYAVRRIAHSLGILTLSREDYATEREAMIARTGRSGDAQMAAAFVLPTLNQIGEVIHQETEREGGRPDYDWDALLVDAGLERRDASALRGLSPAQAVELFAAEFGKAPGGSTILQQWAEARQLRFGFFPNEVILHEVHELNGRRAAEGLPEHEPLQPSQVNWTEVQPVESPTRRRLRPRGSWAKSNCVAGMAIAMTKLTGRERLTQTTLKREAKKDSDVPSYSPVYRAIAAHNAEHGTDETFEQWREEAAKLSRKTGIGQLRELAAPVLTGKQQLDQMNEGFEELREDPQAAAEFDAETAAWDTASADVGRV